MGISGGTIFSLSLYRLLLNLVADSIWQTACDTRVDRAIKSRDSKEVAIARARLKRMFSKVINMSSERASERDINISKESHCRRKPFRLLGVCPQVKRRPVVCK